MVREGRKKDPNAARKIRACFAQGTYRDTRPASERKEERGINILEIERVVESGRWVKAHDLFHEEHQAWNYAMVGKTIDGRHLRIAVALDDELCALIITAIDLDV